MEQAKKVIPNDRLRDERQLRGWTRAYLAAKLQLADPKTIGRWERGVAAPNAYFRRQLCAAFQLEPWELGLEPEHRQLASDRVGAGKEAQAQREDVGERAGMGAGVAMHWSVPYQHNRFFTGRQELLQALEKHFHEEQAVALSQSVALHGLGGIGKTQVALE